MAQPEIFTLPCRFFQQFPFGAPVGHVTKNLDLEKSRTAFLIIDVYGLGFDEESPPGNVSDLYVVTKEQYKEVAVNHIRPAKASAKRLGLPIIYLCNYLAPSTTVNNEWRQMSLRGLNVDVLEEWREPTDIFKYSKAVAPEEGDYQILKQHYSGFFETHLESLLKELDIKNLIVVGFDGLLCLHTTVIDALFRNYRVVALRDCIGTMEFPETIQDRTCHWLAIRYIESNVGYTSTSTEFIQAVDQTLALLP